MNYLNNYSQFQETNEGFKSWLSTFLLLANLGVVPLSVKTADAQTKKEFVEKQPDSKIDAAKFLKYLNLNGSMRPIDQVWTEFIKTDTTVKSNLSDVKNYINKDGKIYRFETKYQSQDFSSVNIMNFEPVNYVTDMGSFFPDSLEPKINNWISDYESKTTIEIAVITVQDLNGEDIGDYALETANRLGVGKKGNNNGIVLVFSMDDRKSNIEVGRGMEEFLTDGKCSEILNNIIKPNFKEGKYTEGTMMALESIRAELGDEVFAKKVEWKKERDRIEKQEMSDAINSFLTILVEILALGAILGPIGYLIHRRMKISEAKKQIEVIKKQIEDIKTKFPKLNSLKSNKLTTYLNKTLELFNQDISKGEMKYPEYEEFLISYIDIINDSIVEYHDLKETISGQIENIKNYDLRLERALSRLDNAILSYSKLKEYGINVNEPAQKSLINSLSSEGEGIVKLLSTDIDMAINKYGRFLSKVSVIEDTGSEAISKLSSAQEAEAKLKRAQYYINSELDDMKRYKKWKKSNEGDDLDSLIKNFMKEYELGYEKTEIMKMASKLEKVLSSIRNIKNLWKKRKQDEEEEEEERRRKERRKREEEERRNAMSSYSSSSSWSSSDSSGSSFGGFGGGSFGGGGASSGW
jgi:uncharacterized membrane protein YgcG